MSLFYGIFYKDGGVPQQELLEKMKQAPPRPFDRFLSMAAGPVGMGQKTLWTTPESIHEAFPVVDRAGRMLAGDIRLDNRDALARIFGVRDVESLGDGALVLMAYEKWGDDCARHLLGDFAFALWDPAAKKLFCARDCFGIKPFCYYDGGGFFVFSSSVHPILAVPGVPRRLDEGMIGNFLLWDHEDQEKTLYSGISRLPAAHVLKISSGGGAKSRYWSLSPDYELKLGSNAEYAERFRGIFAAAVRCRLRSAYPVGACLSGGLDSSSAAGMAAKLLHEKSKELHVFSAVFKDASSTDESDYIRAVASLKGIKAHWVECQDVSPFFEAERTFEHVDEFHNSDLTMFWGGIYPAARNLNVRVLLDGDGGDEVVYRGYPYLAELWGQGRFIEFFRTAKALSENLGHSFWGDTVWMKGLRPHTPRPLLLAWRVARWGHRALWFDRKLFNPDFLKRIGIDRTESLQIGREVKSPRSVRQDHFEQLTTGRLMYDIQVSAAASAAFGIEHRYPFYDKRLAEFCLSLPSDQKLYRGWTRIVMRRALHGIVPDRVRWRGGKVYLDEAATQGMAKFEAGRLEDMLSKHSPFIEAYFNRNELKRTYDRFLSKPTYESATIIGQAILFALWREYAERNILDQPERSVYEKESQPVEK